MMSEFITEGDILLHILDEGDGVIAIVECMRKGDSDSQYYLYDDSGCENVHQYQEKLSSSLQVIGSNNFSGIVVTHVNGDCGLLDKLPNRYTGTKVLSYTWYSHFSYSGKLLHDAQIEYNPDSVLCTQSFFEKNFKFFYNRGKPPSLYDLPNTQTNGNVENQGTMQSTPLKDSPLMLRIEANDFTVQFTGKIARINDQMFCNANIFQVPHHTCNTPTLSRADLKRFPDERHIENAATLLALHHCKDLLAAEIDKLAKNHVLYKKSIAFQAYFFGKETKDSHNENKFEKGFRKMFLTHDRLANDPDDCFTIDNPQLSWYHNDSGKVFSNETRNAVEQERKNQLKMILFICDCVKWAYFYQNINADLYFASTGPECKEPNVFQVLIGIAIACRKKKARCRIAITTIAAFMSISQFFTKSLRDYISSGTEIWYLNNFDCNKPINVRQHPFFTISSSIQLDAKLKYKKPMDSPKVIYNPLDSMDTRFEGMTALCLSEIRTNQDFNVTSLSSMKMNLFLNSPTQKFKLHPDKRRYLLGQYLNFIGHPNPYGLITAEEVLQSVVGSVVVSQLKNLLEAEILQHLNSEIIIALLSSKVKGQSEFTLNSTQTAATAAFVNARNCSAKIADNTITICNIRFVIRNAKTSKMTLTLESSLTREPINLLQGLQKNAGCVGITLAEHVVSYDPKGFFWPSARQQTFGRILTIILGKFEALTILQGIPMFLSHVIASCNVKHYLSYYNFDEKSILLEACIHIHPPEKSITFFCNIELHLLSSVSIHIIPKRETHEMSIQIEGTGIVNGQHVTLKYSNSVIPSHVEIAFASKYLPLDMFNHLGENSPPDYCLSSFQENEKYYTKLICSQTAPGLKQPEILLSFQKDDIDSWKALLPCSIPQFKNAQSYITIQSFNSIKPVAIVAADFLVVLNNDEKKQSINLHFSLQCHEAKRCHISISPLTSVIGTEVLHVIKLTCNSMGRDFISDLMLLPLLNQIMESLSLRNISCSVCHGAVEAIKMSALAPAEVLFICKPCFRFQNASLSICYDSHKKLSVQFKGMLFLQLQIQENFHEYSFNSNCSLVLDNNRWLLSFDLFENLTLENIIEGFGWSSSIFLANPILSSVFSLPVKFMRLEVNSLSMAPHISKAEISIYLEELDIGLATLTHIHLTVKIQTDNADDEEKVYFELNAMIGEYLHVKLEYVPENNLMEGEVTVSDFKSVVAPVALDILNLDCLDQSFINLKLILENCFMNIFDNKSQVQSGTVDFMKLKICIPVKKHDKFTLHYVELRVKDYVPLKHCIVDHIQFEYSKSSFPGTNGCLARVTGIITNTKTEEMVNVTFDVTNVDGVPSALVAEIKPIASKHSVHLKTVIQLGGCKEPTLPNVSLPQILNLPLISGTMFFALNYPLQVIGFDVAAIIPSWDIFSDPVFNVHDLIVRAVWNCEYPVAKLIFDDCTLLFRDFKLNVGGEILPDKVQMKCESNSLPPDQLFFKHLLQDLTPKACICPTIPSDINLPALAIDNVAIDVNLQALLRTFSFNGYIPFSTSWTFEFGDNGVVVDEVGGALEWAINKNSLSTYTAKLHGDLHLGMINVSMQMILGRNIDSIITATVQNIQYGRIADYLAYQCTENDQTEPTLNSLVPTNLQDIAPFTATLALNITRKQFLLCGSVVHWGMGTLLVGYLSDQSEMDYTVMIDVNSSFSFSKCSDSLAFIDDYISVRSAKLVVSSVDLSKLSTVISAFEGAYQGEINNPFSTIRKSNELCADEIKKGTTLYAVLNVCQSQRGTLANLFELGDQTLATSEIIIKVSFQSLRNFQVYAFIERILLFGMLEFKKIKLKYTLERKQDNSHYYFLELEGSILFRLDMTVDDSKSISFDGKLSISPVEAMFEASTSGELIKRPAGLNICVRKLSLQFAYSIGKQNSVPEICIQGFAEIGRVDLICRLLLKGNSFKAIEIILKSGLSLTALFTSCNVDWSATSLNIGIVRGRFYYAREETLFTIDKNPIKYLSGYNGEMVVTIFKWDFEIKVSIPHDKSSLMILGSSLRPIDLGFAMLTGTGDNREKGPGVRYTNKKLSLLVGVTMFKQNFEGEFSYLTDKKAFEGSICYLGRFLWMENPKLGIRWSKEHGIEITHFPLLPSGAFDFLSAMARFAKVLFSLVCGLITWSIELDIRTGKNPDPERYLVKLILSGNITVSIAGFIKFLAIPLPDIPLRILKMDNFSLSKLPQFLIRCLWESAGDIFSSLLTYLNPVKLAWRMGKAIIDGVIKTITNVINVAKKVAKKAWKTFKSWFGFSAFIVDSESKAILGYIYAGKNGRKLHNIKYTVNNFGAFLAANTIKEVAKDVHMTATACMHLNDTYMENLNELKQQTNQLSAKLNLAADDILCVTYISLNFSNSTMYLQWQVGNDEGEQYSEDEGDIEYTMKIVAITVKRDRVLGLNVQTREIFNDFVIPEKIIEVIPIISQEQEHIASERSSVESDNNLSQSDSVVEPDVNIPDSSQDDDSTEDKETPDPQPGDLELEDKEEGNNITGEHSINDSQTKQVVKLSALVPIEQSIIDNAILISISLQPTVTLRVKTLPPENPMVESMDEYWMENIKKTINETGREKEVTLFGKRGFIKHFPRQAESETSENEIGITAEFSYSDEEKLIVVEGEIQSNTTAEYYLLHIFDTSDESIIVKELLIPSILSSEESSEIVNKVDKTEFKLCLDPFKLPYNSPGPYAVAVTSLTNDFKCIQHQAANISGFDLCRCESPVNPSIVLPNRSSSDDSTCVCVSWDFTEETTLNYGFMIMLKCTTTNENTRTAKEIDTSCLSKSESEDEQVAFTDTKIISFDEARNKAPSELGDKDNSSGSYSFVFDLKELYLKYKTPLDSGMNVKCDVLTVCENNEKLPSLPLSQEFIVVSPPSNFKLYSSDNNVHKPGVFACWRNTLHAISYQIDVVCDNDTKKKYCKLHRPNINTDFKSLTKSKAHLDIDDFQNLPSTTIQTYQLCVYALGFGEDLLRSLVPTFAKQQVVVLPVKFMYNPIDNVVTVAFTPSCHTSDYVVALYQYNNTYSLLCERQISVSSCEFGVKKLRNMGLKDGNTVTACVYPAAGDSSNVIYFGVSNNYYNISPPDKLSVKAKYQRNWAISDVSISWSPTDKGQWYEYGMQSLNGEIMWSSFTFKTDTVISSRFMPHTSSSTLLQMFVRRNNNGNGFLNSDVRTSHEATVFQCIVTEDGESVVFTSVSLIKECNICSVNIIANCLLPVFQNRLFLKGYPFSNYWFGSRILNKFLCFKGYKSGIFRSYCYAFDLLDGCKKGKNEWNNLRPLQIVCPQKWHSRIHILVFIRCRRVKKLNRAWNKVEFSFAIKIYTTTASTSKDTKKQKIKQIESTMQQQPALEEQETYEHIPEEAVKNVTGIENVVVEGASESYMKKGKKFFKNVMQKGSENVRSLLNLEPSKHILFQHSSKGQVLSVSDKGLDKQGQVAVDKFQEVYLVRVADINKFHSIDFKISTKLCIIEEAHLFATYI